MDADDVEVVEETSNSQTNPKKRMRQDHHVDPDPTPKRVRPSSFSVMNALNAPMNLFVTCFCLLTLVGFAAPFSLLPALL